jgi:NAD(P)-dependent dehydrogenase (short-subunit alcohol dehydrogenase family)
MAKIRNIYRKINMKYNKHVLILGGSSDIGIEVVKIFLRLKWEVTAQYFKNKKNLSILKSSGKLNLIKFNFANEKYLVSEKLIIKKFNKRYDSIINLVGYIDNKGFENTNLKNILKSLTANAILPILVEKVSVKKMLTQKWGRILNCSSIGVKFGGGVNSYNYALSKHCLEFIPNSYKNWAKRNVFINNIRIGVTNTKIHKRLKKNIRKRIKLIPINRMAEPKEIAAYIVNLTTENNSYITGQTLTVSGGE